MAVESGHWNYAVPLENEDNSYLTDHKPIAADGDLSSRGHRQPLSNQVNGSYRSKGRRPIQPAPNSASSRPPLQDPAEISGGEAKPPLDLYKPSHEKMRGTSREPEQGRVKRKGSYGADATLDEMYYVEGDSESKWIHRDKLAKIESQEMEEIRKKLVNRPSRSGSKSSKKPLKSGTSGDFGDQAPDLQQDEDVAMNNLNRQRGTSAIEDDEEVRESLSNQASPGQNAMSGHVRRPSTSRIPIPNSSPTGTAGGPEGEISPTSRNMSNGIKTTRARSGSSGSQNLLNTSAKTSGAGGLGSPDLKTSEPTTPVTERSSPTKAKSPSAASPSSGARKTSRGGIPVAGQQRPRTASGQPNDSPRPGTSSEPRPPTARPEGDPPWLATMYKPDPRLPPDKQMLPTHAKRLAQEQEERERKAVEVTEQSEFVLMDSEEQDIGDNALPNGQQSDVEKYERMRDTELTKDDTRPSVGQVERDPTIDNSTVQLAYAARSSEDFVQEAAGQWPLKTPSLKGQSPKLQQQGSPKQENGVATNGSTGTPTVEHGGYNLMPTIQNPKEMQDRLSQRSRTSNRYSDTNAVAQPTRVLEPPEEVQDEKQKKKGGCGGCCAVM